MGYNKKAEEIKWKSNKKKEEMLMRQYNMHENLFSELYDYDWNDFKKNRNFHRHENITKDTLFLIQPAATNAHEINSIPELLDIVENESLLEYMKKTDKIVLTILLLKINDYSIKEISILLNMTPNAIYKRIRNFRKNLPK